MRAVLFVFSAISACAAGPFTFGVRGGLPFTDAVDALGNRSGVAVSNSSFVFGPTAGVRLPAGLSVELDLLYRSFKLRSPLNATDGRAWEFPLQLRWAGSGVLSPLFGAGFSFRNLGGLGRLPDLAGNAGILQDDKSAGLVLGAGFQIKVPVVRFTPELRYTRWGGLDVNDPFRRLYRVNRNQFDFLIGLNF
jgi:hypothetical protein